MNHNDYFGKFKSMNPDEDANLSLDGGGKKKILWLSDDIVNKTPIGKSLLRAMGVMLHLPKNVYIQYSSCDESIDELTSDCSLVVITQAAGRREGYDAVKQIVESGIKVPKIFTAPTLEGMAKDIKTYLASNTNCYVSLNQLGTLSNRILEYVKK